MAFAVAKSERAETAEHAEGSSDTEDENADRASWSCRGVRGIGGIGDTGGMWRPVMHARFPADGREYTSRSQAMSCEQDVQSMRTSSAMQVMHRSRDSLPMQDDCGDRSDAGDNVVHANEEAFAILRINFDLPAP